VQVDPLKFNLKPPGSELLKLKCDDPLSNFTFNLKLRRYAMELASQREKYRLLRENVLLVVRDYNRILSALDKEERRQGLTLVHLSAHLEPCLSQENTLHTLRIP